VYTLIRGLRTTADFEQETIIAQANKKLNPDVETVFIPASQRSSFLSSTVVRDVLLHHGDTSIFVAPGINLEDYR
jgi:pantetheine-phosphate adenylyltransferase